MPKIYDNQDIPAYLFAGGTILSFVVLILLVQQLPDLFVDRIWMGSLFRYMVSIVNSKYLPASGPVVLVTTPIRRASSAISMPVATDWSTNYPARPKPARVT